MVSRTTNKIIKMKTNEEKEKENCIYCNELIEEDHICYTCCGDEITGDVEDIGLCPTCKEHI